MPPAADAPTGAATQARADPFISDGAATWWVISAKREETRVRRLRTLIEDSAQERLLGHLQRGKPATSAGSG